MAIMDTHEAFKLLQNAGLDDEKAEAIVRVVGVGQDSLATKVDLEALAQTTKADLEALELRLRHDLTLRLGAMVFTAAGVQVVIVVFLLTQFLSN
ncbi:MAG: hypothetical protein OXE05_03345 [Chloroflexi bacterium]|nr:hypothetical protein [Chloroflexota bacterium]